MIGKGVQELLALAAGAYTGFRGIKHVVVFLLSTGYHPLTGYNPQLYLAGMKARASSLASDLPNRDITLGTCGINTQLLIG